MLAINDVDKSQALPHRFVTYVSQASFDGIFAISGRGL